MQLDKSKLKEAYAENPSGLETFFSDSNVGVVAKFSDAIDRLTDADRSLLTNRSESLLKTIELNEKRIEKYNETLGRQRERLLIEFYQLEQVIAGLQQNLTALQGLQPLAPLSIQRRN